MRLGVLFSGGKDSTLALHIASKTEQIACLISINSSNPESYMFHTPNIWIVRQQAIALDLPLIEAKTEGKKELELFELKQAITDAIRKYNIEGIVTGAVESVYQSSRIQKICDDLDIWCFNPLWLKDQISVLDDLVNGGFKVMITGVFAYPLGEEWLGKIIDRKTIGMLDRMRSKYHISPTGEGGEIETTVLDAPLFRRKIKIIKSKKIFDGKSGTIEIDEVGLLDK